jgi:hypothetical protein
VATVEARREAELEEKLAAAELKIAELQARGVTVRCGRWPQDFAFGDDEPSGEAGCDVDSLEAGALDAALVSLSLEQRIAVKAQLMRAGLIWA